MYDGGATAKSPVFSRQILLAQVGDILMAGAAIQMAATVLLQRHGPSNVLSRGLFLPGRLILRQLNKPWFVTTRFKTIYANVCD